MRYGRIKFGTERKCMYVWGRWVAGEEQGSECCLPISCPYFTEMPINMQSVICQVPWLISNWLLVFSPNNAAFRWQVSFSCSVLLFPSLAGLYIHDNKLIGRRFMWKQVSERKRITQEKPLLNSPKISHTLKWPQRKLVEFGKLHSCWLLQDSVFPSEFCTKLHCS